MPRFETLIERSALLLRGAGLVLIVGAGLASIVASGGGGGPPEVTTVTHPRVAMLNANTAVISHYQISSLRSGGEQFTWRHQLVTGTSELVSRRIAPPIPPPFHLSAIGSGVAVQLALDGNGSTQGCAIRAIGAASCTGLAFQDRGYWTVTTVAVQAGQAIGLYGEPSALLERTYDSGSGWSASRPGPALAGATQPDPNRSLVRWRDGSMFLVAATSSTIAARYDAQQGAWLAAETLGGPLAGDTDYKPQIALHPQAPAPAPIAVWQGNQGVAFSIWDSGAGWSASALVPGGIRGSKPTVAMWPNGDGLVVWHSGSSDAIVAVRRVNGVWETPLSIGALGGSQPGKIGLGLDDQGNAVALWVRSNELQSANFLAGDGWQPASTVGAIVNKDDFDVAMAPEGRALAVWARPAGGGDPGSRLATAEVGPSALTLTAQRYTFGGDTLPLTIRLANAPTQATTVSLSTSLPSGSISLPPSLPVAANQSEVTFNVPTSATTGFVDGYIIVSYGAARVNRPVTLMPLPTGAVLTVNPPSVLGGEPATINVQVAPVYPIALDLQMASNNAVATVPAQVTTGMTSSAAAMPVTTMTTTTAQTATFSAGFRGLVLGTGSLQVNPTALGQSALTITIQGSGAVISFPAGINCYAAPSASCGASYPIGTPVTLLPTPVLGNRFFGWDGDPDCSDGLLTMTTARACTAIFQPQLPPYSDGDRWTHLGRQLFNLSTVNPSPAMALDGVNPVVASVYNNGGSSVAQLTVTRFEFNAQAGVANSSLNVDILQAASEPSLVTTNQGLPYVAWVEGTGPPGAPQNLYVKRWLGGSRWVSVGTPGTALNFVAGSRASSPSIALDAELRPMVAWIENGAVKFKRFNGTAWVQEPGGEGPASINADRVRLSSFSALVGVAVPVIAWTQGSGMTRALKVARDFTFTALPAQVNAPSLNSLTEFAVLAEGVGGIVTWGDGDRPFTVRSQRWNGAAWVDVTAVNQVASSLTNRLLSVAMARNGLVVAHAEASDVISNGSSIQVSWKHAGNAWLPLTETFPFLGDALISLTTVELRTAGSPIVVVVLRNALNQYVWQVLRYYPP